MPLWEESKPVPVPVQYASKTHTGTADTGCLWGELGGSRKRRGRHFTEGSFVLFGIFSPMNMLLSKITFFKLLKENCLYKKISEHFKKLKYS